MKKTNIKGLKKIKWENIIFIILVIIDIICMKEHIKLNGLYIELGMELIIYLSMSLVARYVIKDIRKNPENWFFDKED